MTVEDLVAEINAGGWYVSSLYQRAPRGDWGASLRANGDWSTASADGSTMLEALSAAWEKREGRMTEAKWQKVKAQQTAPKPGNIPRRRLEHPENLE